MVLKPQLCVSVLGYSDIDTSKVMVLSIHCMDGHNHISTHTLHAHITHTTLRTQRVHVFLQGVHLHSGNCKQLSKDIAERVTSVERQLAEGEGV